MKTISRSNYLKALALFHMASELIKRASELESELTDLLGKDDEYSGHVSDAIYNNDHSVRAFDKALGREGITVQRPRAKAA